MKFLVALLAASLPLSAVARPLLPTPRVNTPIESVVIDASRTVRLDGPIIPSMIQNATESLRALDKKGKTTFIIINSPGGSVHSGLEFIREMETAESALVCVIEMRAYSMAAIIAAYCPTLYVYKFGSVMFHEASYAQDGRQSEHVKNTAVIERFFDEIYTDIALQLGMSLEEYRKRIHEEWWMTSGEAARLGFADAVVLKMKYKNGKNIILQLLDSLTRQPE